MTVEDLLLKIETIEVSEKDLKKLRNLIQKMSTKAIMTRAAFLRNEQIKQEILQILDKYK